MKKIHVLIADDDFIVRNSLAALIELEDDIEIVGSVSNGFDAIDLAMKQHPDVILLDESMPYLDGFETIKILREKKIKASIIFLCINKDLLDMRSLKQLGISAVIEKSTTEINFISEIRSIFYCGGN